MNLTEFYERYWQHSEAELEHGQLVKPRQRLLREALSPLPPRACVLDSGCGNGVFTAFLSQLGYDAVGLDISSTAIGFARQRYPGVRFEAASLDDRLPFHDQTFDAIWCTEVVEHLFDVQAALSEIQQIISRDDPPAIYYMQRQWTTVLRNDIEGFVFNPINIGTFNFYTMSRKDSA